MKHLYYISYGCPVHRPFIQERFPSKAKCKADCKYEQSQTAKMKMPSNSLKDLPWCVL